MKRAGKKVSSSTPQLVIERSRSGAVSRELWKGLIAFNRKKAGSLHYRRTVISARSPKGQLLGGLILESYWRESYVELLWVSTKSRSTGLGGLLLRKAEDLAWRRGSRIIHLNTFSFQAPRFYEAHGYRRFGRLTGSPAGHSRHYFVKYLRAPRLRRTG
jgi:GNAT superfamily N-acetyltransferase